MSDAATPAAPATWAGRVLGVVAGTYIVEREEGAPVECVLAGRLKQGPVDRVVTGDRVTAELLEDGSARIIERLPRRSRLARRAGGGRGLQVIAANLDGVAAVFAAARPEPDLAMLDRLLVLAELSGLAAFIVVNKMDLAGDVAGPDDPLAPFRAARDAGYPLFPTSARTGRGLDALAGTLSGRVTVMAGPSGTGKSSLLNALVPEAARRVGAVSERTGRGRHTTVNATLVPLGGGGYLGDTPGLQVAGLPDPDPSEIGDAFPELVAVAEGCRFADCRHRSEPECAVRRAVERGDVARSRYDAYLGLLREAEEAAVPGRRGRP
ncbi:MAG TPA: ribosome small subunit-dependent GTPase A [Gemmatimonadota bacterium]|nr:ribosome small subunit-dependent GTPase A [Gemmatimonadota bacterium]